MENPRQRTEGKSEVFHSINNALAVGTQASSRSRDPWLALYLLNVRTLNAQFGGGPVSDHVVRTATNPYQAFCSSCDPFIRTAWKSIHGSSTILPTP
jgi:hypothetical protein